MVENKRRSRGWWSRQGRRIWPRGAWATARESRLGACHVSITSLPSLASILASTSSRRFTTSSHFAPLACEHLDPPMCREGSFSFVTSPYDMRGSIPTHRTNLAALANANSSSRGHSPCEHRTRSARARSPPVSPDERAIPLLVFEHPEHPHRPRRTFHRHHRLRMASRSEPIRRHHGIRNPPRAAGETGHTTLKKSRCHFRTTAADIVTPTP